MLHNSTQQQMFSLKEQHALLFWKMIYEYPKISMSLSFVPCLVVFEDKNNVSDKRDAY